MSPAAMMPVTINAALTKKHDFLCLEEMAIFHSGLTKTPLWVAQRLTAEGVVRAESVAREDVFHSEAAISPDRRAELLDYKRSGYDRGHMAPAADMATIVGQDQSFSLANMVPQNSKLNRGLWARLEAITRDLAEAYGEVFVVTGPAFKGQSLKRLNGRVLVPTHVYKAVYLPSVGQGGAWWAANEGQGDQYEIISIQELERRIGIDVFPGVSVEVKAKPVALPQPGVKPQRHGSSEFSSDSGKAVDVVQQEGSTWYDLAAGVIRYFMR